MEKNRIRSVTNGKSMRMSYQRQKEVLQMPNLIEVQKDSYQWFLDEGLNEVFEDISPIADYSGKLSLEFVGFSLLCNLTFTFKGAAYVASLSLHSSMEYFLSSSHKVKPTNSKLSLPL